MRGGRTKAVRDRSGGPARVPLRALWRTRWPQRSWPEAASVDDSETWTAPPYAEHVVLRPCVHSRATSTATFTARWRRRRRPGSKTHDLEAADVGRDQGQRPPRPARDQDAQNEIAAATKPTSDRTQNELANDGRCGALGREDKTRPGRGAIPVVASPWPRTPACRGAAAHVAVGDEHMLRR